ncbi:MAG: DoxX family protein [Halobacteriales archaeon]
MSTHATLRLVGQVILGAFFVLTGVNQLFDTERLAEWTESKGIPYALMVVYLTGFGLLVGGVTIIADPFVGVNIRTGGVALLIVLLLGITPVMHNFWNMAESEGIYPVEATNNGEEYMLPPQQTELFGFLRNIALIGALLALL